MENFPDVVTKLWTGWEIRVIVSVSLLLQIILIIFGSKRKYMTNTLIGILVWLCYLSADSVATFALGNLATNKSANISNLLQAFWAPFLLLHLGGPDTITAYSLEDNELWLRHLLGLLVQVGGAFYVFRRFLSNSGTLAYVAIPMFVAGILKYGERTWVLRSSSANNFRESLLATPKFDDQPSSQSDANLPKDLFCEADYLFKRFKFIFAGLFLPLHQVRTCVSIIRKKEAEDAFKLVAIELGFMYDELYTKATSAFSKFGIFIRCISSASTICALVAFIFVVDKHPYPIIDTIITYLLLGGAICLEFYAFIMLILSDRTYLLVAQQRLPNWIPHCSLQNLSKRKRWSGSMPQLSLIDIILKSKMNKFVQKSFSIIEDLQNSRISSRTDVSADMRKYIFTALVEKSDKLASAAYHDDELKRALRLPGSDEFDRWLLIKHIATELCYDDELGIHGGNEDALDPACKVSKCISSYLFYLLVKRPSFLPRGGRDTRYRETCTIMVKYFESKKTEHRNTSEACKALLLAEVGDLVTLEEKELKENSTFSTGCYLGQDLKEDPNKWKKLSEEWMTFLIYAASECGWKEHGQQLTKGGELLTHVSLLMAHLGLSPLFYETYHAVVLQAQRG